MATPHESRASGRMGSWRTPVRHLDDLVPGRRRCLYRLHRDRGAGARFCHRRLRVFRPALHHTRVPVRVRGHAAPVEHRRESRPCHRGRRGARAICLAPARGRGRGHRHRRHHALYRAAAGRHAGGDPRVGARRRYSADRGVSDPCTLYLYRRAARAGADRVRERLDDLRGGDRGGSADPAETRWLCAYLCRRRCGIHRPRQAEHRHTAVGGAEAALRHAGAGLGVRGVHVPAHADRRVRRQIG